ncbi:hypothetical protein J437_LFUL008690, partial [Ladona fulva]
MKCIIHTIAFPLLIVFKTFFQSVIFPNTLKYSKMFPIIDKGNSSKYLCKAFDCVFHNTLKQKFAYYGFQGLELKLMESYARNQKQSFIIKRD